MLDTGAAVGSPGQAHALSEVTESYNHIRMHLIAELSRISSILYRVMTRIDLVWAILHKG